MNAELKEKWLEALRSGKYKQTKGVLAQIATRGAAPTGHCCLGVLCEVLPQRPYELTFGYGMPEPHTLYAAGVEQRYAERLASMNDSGSTFSEIADYIEVNL